MLYVYCIPHTHNITFKDGEGFWLTLLTRWERFGFGGNWSEKNWWFNNIPHEHASSHFHPVLSSELIRQKNKRDIRRWRYRLAVWPISPSSFTYHEHFSIYLLLFVCVWWMSSKLEFFCGGGWTTSLRKSTKWNFISFWCTKHVESFLSLVICRPTTRTRYDKESSSFKHVDLREPPLKYITMLSSPIGHPESEQPATRTVRRVDDDI